MEHYLEKKMRLHLSWTKFYYGYLVNENAQSQNELYNDGTECSYIFLFNKTTKTVKSKQFHSHFATTRGFIG